MPVFLLLALGLLRVLVVGVLRMLGRVDCYKACNLVLGFLSRGFRRVQVLLGGLRLLLRVDRTNGIGGYRLIIVCGLLDRLRCRCALPRYDFTELARAVALAHGLRCCSSMSG